MLEIRFWRITNVNPIANNGYKWRFDMGSEGVVPSGMNRRGHLSCNHLMIIQGVCVHAESALRNKIGYTVIVHKMKLTFHVTI